MKKIILFLLISVTGYSQQLLLKNISVPTGSYIVGVASGTNSIGTATATIPVSKVTGALANTTSLTINGTTKSFTSTPNFTTTLQDVVNQSPIISGVLSSSSNGQNYVRLNNDSLIIQNQQTSVFAPVIELTPGALKLNSDNGIVITNNSNNIDIYSPSVQFNGNEIATTNQLPTITSGTNITVSGTTPNYTVSVDAALTGSVSANTSSIAILQSSKQNTLVAGTNVTLNTNTISATTPTLTVVNGTLSGSYPTQTLTIPTNSTTIVAGANITTTLSGTTYTIASSPSNYVTPEMYGAIGDGSTDDATAIQNAVNSGSLVLFGAKNYRVNSSITLNGNITIIGSGSLTTISSVSNTPVFNLTGNNNIIQDLQVFGNSAGTSQIGVQILGVASLSVSILNNKISNCIFKNLYTGVSTTSVVGSSSGAKHEGSLTLLNNTFFGNNYGFRAGARSEYNITTLNKFEQCSTAVELSGGNNNLFGDYITDCSVGLQFISSSNDTHSNATGVKFNHNTINITGDHSLDFEFNGCQFFAGNIILNSVGKTTFNGGEIGLSTNTLSINNSPAYFNNVNFSEAVGTYTLVAGNKPIFVNCYRGTNMMITPTVTTTTSFILNNGAVAKGICNFYDDDALKLAVSDGGHLTFADGVNIVLSSTTGTKLGTATSQKLGFFNATPIIQPTATTDLGTVLSNLGLRASGTAFPITTTGATSFSNTSMSGTLAVTNSITTGNFVGSTSKTAGIGYAVGSGSTVTQATNRTTGVTINAITGSITLVSAAGSTSWQTFTVTNSAVAATDVIIVNQQSGTDLYQIFVTNVAAGSFKISFATTGGTTTEQPVFNFAVIKGQTN